MTRWIPAALVCLLACSGEEHHDPEIVSFSIDPSEVVAGSDVTSMVEVLHFELTGEASDQHDDDADHDHEETTETAERGHAHIYLDDLGTNPLLMQTATAESVTIPADTVAGTHVLIARLHDEEHLIIEPQITAEVEVTVLE